MGVIFLVIVLIIIVLYLIILESSNAKELQEKSNQDMLEIMKLIGTSKDVEEFYLKQLKEFGTTKTLLLLKIIKQKIEIKGLKNANQDLREEHQEYIILKNKYDILNYKFNNSLKDIIIDLLDIRDIDKLEITEEKKYENRKIIVSKALKELTKKTIELDNPDKSI